MSVLKTFHGMKDVLGLDSSFTYTYLVHGYSIHHSTLTLHICESTDANFVPLYECHFAPVAYLDLCPTWQGGKLVTASLDACKALMREIGINAGIEDRDASLERLADDTVVLYEADPPNRRRVRILAGNAIEIHHLGKGVQNS